MYDIYIVVARSSGPRTGLDLTRLNELEIRKAQLKARVEPSTGPTRSAKLETAAILEFKLNVCSGSGCTCEDEPGMAGASSRKPPLADL